MRVFSLTHHILQFACLTLEEETIYIFVMFFFLSDIVRFIYVEGQYTKCSKKLIEVHIICVECFVTED